MSNWVTCIKPGACYITGDFPLPTFLQCCYNYGIFPIQIWTSPSIRYNLTIARVRARTELAMHHKTSLWNSLNATHLALNLHAPNPVNRDPDHAIEAEKKVAVDLEVLVTREIREGLEAVPNPEIVNVLIRRIEWVEGHLVAVATTERGTGVDNLETDRILVIENNLDAVLDRAVVIGDETDADGHVPVTGVDPDPDLVPEIGEQLDPVPETEGGSGPVPGIGGEAIGLVPDPGIAIDSCVALVMATGSLWLLYFCSQFFGSYV